MDVVGIAKMCCSRSSTDVFHVEEVKPNFWLDRTNQRGSVASKQRQRQRDYKVLENG